VKVLVIKTTSMGDVIHALPALTDAARAIPEISFDWVVEGSFAEIPSWHARVDRTIPVAIRRWRKNIWQTCRSPEWRNFKKSISSRDYDCVIDAQGLLKSAWLTRYVSAASSKKVFGLDRHSAREPLASLFYDHKIPVAKSQHAVERVRQLFAAALGYEMAGQACDYGLDPERLPQVQERDYLVFLHGTTWPTKHWPEPYWFELAQQANRAGLRVLMPWGNDTERQRAERIAAGSDNVQVLPKSNLNRLAGYLNNAKAVVSVDTGLAHLAAALGTPNITLYGPTDPMLVGTRGANQVHLESKSCPPFKPGQKKNIEPEIFAPLTPEIVWQALSLQLKPGG
jgi:heptosyltransferase-1